MFYNGEVGSMIHFIEVHFNLKKHMTMSGQIIYYLLLCFSSLAALGLVENNASNIVAAMLVSPLMGPVMSITFGVIISDRSLVRSGFESLVLGMFLSLLFGFIFGLILGSTDMPWGFGDWPTEEMKGR